VQIWTGEYAPQIHIVCHKIGHIKFAVCTGWTRREISCLHYVGLRKIKELKKTLKVSKQVSN